MFLIHYGWRGIYAAIMELLKQGRFLIHYGWRGMSLK